MKTKGGGTLKGAAFERKLCRALSLLVSNGERDDLLWRSAMSGGRATIGKRTGKKREAQAGDVSSIDASSHWLVRDWYIEAKHYHDLQILRGAFYNSGKLHRFWVRTLKEARHYRKRPMLLVKQDRQPELLIVKSGERVIGPLVMILPQWDADVFLFTEVQQLLPAKPKERVLLEE